MCEIEYQYNILESKVLWTINIAMLPCGKTGGQIKQTKKQINIEDNFI